MGIMDRQTMEPRMRPLWEGCHFYGLARTVQLYPSNRVLTEVSYEEYDQSYGKWTDGSYAWARMIGETPNEVWVFDEGGVSAGLLGSDNTLAGMVKGVKGLRHRRRLPRLGRDPNAEGPGLLHASADRRTSTGAPATRRSTSRSSARACASRRATSSSPTATASSWSRRTSPPRSAAARSSSRQGHGLARQEVPADGLEGRRDRHLREVVQLRHHAANHCEVKRRWP